MCIFFVVKERTARLRAKKDFFVRVCSSSFHENNDEVLKVIDVSPIKSLFCNMNLHNDGTRSKSTLARKRSDNLEYFDLDAKIDKSEIEEVKNLDINDNCSSTDCISLLQSVLNSPHAYSRNKAFTEHIVDA